MGKVVVDIAMSLDGFIAGTNVSPQLPMGDDGLRLHEWIFDKKTDIDSNVIKEVMETSGAVIVGRHTYDVAIDDAWGGESPFAMPALVVSHRKAEKIVEGFTFITGGIEETLQQAKAIGGNKNIWIMGGANIIRQFIKAGLVDELEIHLSHILLRKGTRLFDDTLTNVIDLERIRSIGSDAVTHLRFRILK
jgi:dihydrofolate reductase